MDRGGNRGRGKGKGRGRGKGKGTGRGREQRQGSEDVRRQSEPRDIQPTRTPKTEFENQASGEYQVGSRSGGGMSRDKDPMSSESTSSEDMLWVRASKIKSPEASTSHEGTCSEEAASSDDFSPMLRPDAGGKQGIMEVRLIVNHFLVSFHPAQDIFHYDIEITQTASSSKPCGRGQSKNKKHSVSKEDAQQIKNKLVAENRAAFGNAMPVYDGKKNLYSPVRLPEGLFTVKLSKGEDRKEEYTVALKLAKQLDGRRLAEFLNSAQSNHTKIQQEYVQALDLVVRENPSRSRIMIGRCLYPKLQERDGELGGGVVASRGFFQSLIPTAQGLALDVDFSVVVFHKNIGVLDYLRESCSVVCQEFQPWCENDRRKALSALRGLKIRVTHRRTTQKIAISGFTKQITTDLTFEICDDNGHKERTSLVDYFKRRYGLDIRFKLLPCLDISKTPDRPNYVPLEFCQICEGQRYPRDHLSGFQSKNLSMIAAPPANDRLRIINDIMVRADGPRGGPFARQFQITVGANMTEVTGRVLEAPKLKLGDGGRVREVTPRQDDRQWNLNNSHVFDGKHIDKWGLIYFSWQRPSWQEEKSLENFANFLTQRCSDLGIHMNGNPVVWEADDLNKFSNVTALQRVLLNLKAKAGSNLQILICVVRDRHPEKGKFKLVCETDIGLVTQCCLFQYVRKCSDPKFGSQYLANLALKINVKVGGSNAALLTSLSSQIPRFGNSQVIYFGADVNHPGSGDKNSPSVAAVVTSINWPWCNRYVARIRYQKHRQENIEQLGEMSKELLKEYLKVNRQLPEKILFFRDGVSESQFYMVLHKELQSLKKAFSEFSGYNPTISFIVAQKRHHTRLFPSQGQPRTKSGNVMPGTVVDTTIVHPRGFDFFLCSHYGIKGTSKPTHYHVVWDENSFTSDELQTLINNLCYTFARCTKPVSLVPPVYYADLAAYRGRDYVEALASEKASSSSGGASSSSTPLNFPKPHKAVEHSMYFL